MMNTMKAFTTSMSASLNEEIVAFAWTCTQNGGPILNGCAGCWTNTQIAGLKTNGTKKVDWQEFGLGLSEKTMKNKYRKCIGEIYAWRKRCIFLRMHNAPQLNEHKILTALSQQHVALSEQQKCKIQEKLCAT